jgi:hypothetical protein
MRIILGKGKRKFQYFGIKIKKRIDGLIAWSIQNTTQFKLLISNNYLAIKQNLIDKIEYLKHYFDKVDYPKSKRIVYENLCKLLNLPTYLSRKVLAIVLAPKDSSLPSISRAEGFLVFPPETFLGVKEVVAEARQHIQKNELESLVNPSQPKSQYLRVLPTVHQSLSLDSPFLKLACDPKLVSLVTEYLGIFPILRAFHVVYSPNKENYEHSSQFFHLDPEGVKQVKVFIYVEDVDEDCGPFTIVPACESQKIYPEYQGGRISDEFVANFVEKSKFQEIIGPSGTIFLADTSSCFHFGSRKAKKERFIVVFQYVSPFASIFPRFGWIKKPQLAYLAQQNLPIYTKYLLGAR